MNHNQNRLKLQAILEEVIGSKNVYFQPPASIKMKYPAIVYTRTNINNSFANNSVYKQDLGYKITVIEFDPTCEISNKVSLLPGVKFDRSYTVDNLYHNTYTLY